MPVTICDIIAEEIMVDENRPLLKSTSQRLPLADCHRGPNSRASDSFVAASCPGGAIQFPGGSRAR